MSGQSILPAKSSSAVRASERSQAGMGLFMAVEMFRFAEGPAAVRTLVPTNGGELFGHCLGRSLSLSGEVEM